MRRLLWVGVFAVLAACSSGTIEGEVVVGPGQDGLGVMAALWQMQAVPSDPMDPASPTTEELVFQTQFRVGTADASGGRFPYSFSGLGQGRYVVGAYADLFGDGQPTTDELTVDVFSPFLEVNPDDEAKATATRDIYVGLSAPDRTTIKGRLHRSVAAAASPVELLVLDKPLTDPESRLVASRSVAAGDDDLEFSIFNVPPGDAHIVAVDDFSLSGLVSIDAGSPRKAVAGENLEGVDLWMDVQGPELGHVQGEVQLNGALANLQIQLYLFSADPSDPDVEAPLVGFLNVAASNKATVPFNFRSVPVRKLWLAGAIGTADSEERFLSTTRIWSNAEGTASSIELTPEALSKEGLVFPMGVGRISGTISAENATKGVGLWALAMKPGAQGPRVHQYEVVEAPSAGNVSVAYEMFGLEDGTYDMQLVPDVSGDDSPMDEIASEYFFNGTPAKVEIVGGDRAACDFSVKLQSTP